MIGRREEGGGRREEGGGRREEGGGRRGEGEEGRGKREVIRAVTLGWPSHPTPSFPTGMPLLTERKSRRRKNKKKENKHKATEKTIKIERKR